MADCVGESASEGVGAAGVGVETGERVAGCTLTVAAAGGEAVALEARLGEGVPEARVEGEVEAVGEAAPLLLAGAVGAALAVARLAVGVPEKEFAPCSEGLGQGDGVAVAGAEAEAVALPAAALPLEPALAEGRVLAVAPAPRLLDALTMPLAVPLWLAQALVLGL